MIRSYLKDRSILVGKLLLRRDMTCGVPWGSVLGPALWNVFFDALLDLEIPQGVQLVAYADDVCVLGIARMGEQATVLMNPALDTVSTWMRQNRLKLAPQKSEAAVPIIDHIVDQNNLYATQNNKTLKLSADELMGFIGINFCMGYHKLPSYRHYWSTAKNLHLQVISEVMSRDRFSEILSNIHVNDNTAKLQVF